MHHSSTSTYVPNFIEIEETFCGWTDVRTYGRRGADGHLRPTVLGRLGGVDLIKYNKLFIFSLLGQLLRVDLIQFVSNVRPPVRTFVRPSESRKFGHFQRLSPPPFTIGAGK